MKIAYDPQIFLLQTYGGISRYFCEIASRIAKEPSVQVSIVAPMHSNAYLSHVPTDIVSGFRAPKTDRFQTKYGANYPRRALRGLGSLMGSWMLQAMRPDIVHETYFSPYRPRTRCPRRVLTIYDMIHEKFPSSFSHTDKTARYKALATERVDHVICISESTRRDAIEILGLRPDKISVIHLGFDLTHSVGERAGDLVSSTNDPFLLYVGERSMHKNFLGLLEAYATSPQLRTGYRLICFGGGALDMDEQKAIHKLGLDSRQVMQVGGSDQLLVSYYKRASAFIYPSLYEGFGIPPLEAMSYDCPVVCSKTSSIPEVVGDAGEYFDPADIESMRAAIERVVMSESLRKLLIAKGRARLKYFSWDRCAAETLNIYMKLV